MKPTSEYLMEIRFLTNKIRDWYKLSKVEQATIINDSLISLLSKIKTNQVDGSSYEAYKGYMFITIRNYILRAFNRRNQLNNKQYNPLLTEDISINTYLAASQENNLELARLRLIISKLPPIERALIRFLARGWTHNDLARGLDLSINDTKSLIKRTRRKLRLILTD